MALYWHKKVVNCKWSQMDPMVTLVHMFCTLNDVRTHQSVFTFYLEGKSIGLYCAGYADTRLINIPVKHVTEHCSRLLCG